MRYLGRIRYVLITIFIILFLSVVFCCVPCFQIIEHLINGCGYLLNQNVDSFTSYIYRHVMYLTPGYSLSLHRFLSTIARREWKGIAEQAIVHADLSVSGYEGMFQLQV